MRPSIVLGILIVTILAAVTGGEVFAAMTSTNYEVRFDSLGFGGEDTSSSSGYILRDSIGATSGQGSASSSYQIDSGFRAGIFDPAVDFTLFSQDSASQVAATAKVGTVVTVTSTAGISVGDMIALVQDEGGSQVSAIGEVISTTASTVTVDSFRDGGSAPVIDGTNDYLYTLDNSGVSLGTLSDADVSTAIIAWEANVDTDEGYSVYVYEDSELSSGSDTISEVSDGTVSAGDSEYGGRSSDPSLSSTFDIEDAAFTSSLQEVGSRTTVEFKSRDFLTLKASVTDSQEGGNYSHDLTVIYVGDY